MNYEEITVQLAYHDSELKHHGERLDNLESNTKVLTDMATSLAVMAKEQKTLSKKVDAVITKVDVLEAAPGKRWDALITALIGAVVGILVGILLKGGV